MSFFLRKLKIDTKIDNKREEHQEEELINGRITSRAGAREREAHKSTKPGPGACFLLGLLADWQFDCGIEDVRV